MKYWNILLDKELIQCWRRIKWLNNRKKVNKYTIHWTSGGFHYVGFFFFLTLPWNVSSRPPFFLLRTYIMKFPLYKHTPSYRKLVFFADLWCGLTTALVQGKFYKQSIVNESYRPHHQLFEKKELAVFLLMICEKKSSADNLPWNRTWWVYVILRKSRYLRMKLPADEMLWWFFNSVSIQAVFSILKKIIWMNTLIH